MTISLFVDISRSKTAVSVARMSKGVITLKRTFAQTNLSQ